MEKKIYVFHLCWRSELTSWYWIHTCNPFKSTPAAWTFDFVCLWEIDYKKKRERPQPEVILEKYDILHLCYYSISLQLKQYTLLKPHFFIHTLNELQISNPTPNLRCEFPLLISELICFAPLQPHQWRPPASETQITFEPNCSRFLCAILWAADMNLMIQCPQKTKHMFYSFYSWVH